MWHGPMKKPAIKIQHELPRLDKGSCHSMATSSQEDSTHCKWDPCCDDHVGLSCSTDAQEVALAKTFSVPRGLGKAKENGASISLQKHIRLWGECLLNQS